MPGYAAAFALAALALLVQMPVALAQDGCKTVTRSCTELSTGCERLCQNGNNASRCVAGRCMPKLDICKSTGVWRSSATGAACWKTNNRS